MEGVSVSTYQPSHSWGWQQSVVRTCLTRLDIKSFYTQTSNFQRNVTPSGEYGVDLMQHVNPNHNSQTLSNPFIIKSVILCNFSFCSPYLNRFLKFNFRTYNVLAGNPAYGRVTTPSVEGAGLSRHTPLKWVCNEASETTIRMIKVRMLRHDFIIR